MPEFFLSDNGGLFILRRFDVTPSRDSLGFEDMCSLQARGTAQKYTGSYERVAKTIKDFVSGDHLQEARKQFLAVLALSIMIRNGDAHLKNFGALYASPRGPVTLAPVYDLVTTTVYLKKDVPALTLAGTKRWWPRKILERFAAVHLSLPSRTVSEIFNLVAEAVMETRALIPAYIRDHPEFQEIGTRLMAEWAEGVRGFDER